MTQPTPEFLDLQAALAGEYSLRREIGRGGMGVVYLARDVQLDRDVAIKVLPAPLAQHAESRARFLREARIAAGLSHPHIVPIHRVAEAGGFVFFVMSHVDGETLGERLRTRGPLPPVEAMRVLREVAWALAYAHGRGIVHRDVKPDNILLEATTGRALVTDFGIAHGGDHDATSEQGLVMGTAQFMSPEQALGLPIDGRSDIYALGVVGYLAVSGRLPYDAVRAAQQADEVSVSVTRVSPGLPSALGTVIDRCIALDPDVRYSDADTLATALAPVGDVRPTLPATLRAWLSARNRAVPMYVAWSTITGLLSFASLVVMVQMQHLKYVPSMLGWLALAVAPLIPMVGAHLTQARKLFRAGHTLDDLRFALDAAARERTEVEALTTRETEGLPAKVLRGATYAAATGTVTIALDQFMRSHGTPTVFIALGTTAALGVVCNVLEVNLIPAAARKALQTGLRERLWKSRLGTWLARRLGAPRESRAMDAGAFRATEVALGVAASELFAALPTAYRDQLVGLPATVDALEAQAAAARAELDAVAALAPSGADGGALDARRGAASTQLGRSVAALEGIRLDLLRLHANTHDLAPLTTLIDASRLVREDLNRLADATREANRVADRVNTPRLPAARRVPTPA